MVKNKLRLVMAEKRIDNISELMQITGISRNSLNKLWHNENLDSIKLGTLIIICEKLHIKLSDLIEFIPDDEQ